MDPDTFAGPWDFYFLDTLHGWMDIVFEGNSKPGSLLATEDVGRTWKWVSSPGSSGQITFHSLQDGWITSYWWPDRLYVTHNGCKTWQEVSLSAPSQVGAATYRTVLAPLSSKTTGGGFLVLDYSGYLGTPSKLVIYSTVDSGQTLEPIKVLPEAEEAWGERGIPFAIADSAIIVSTGSSAGNVTVAAVPLDGGSS
jgi:photosystem II stability/assembly factor-like uncharacterized protein